MSQPSPDYSQPGYAPQPSQPQSVYPPPSPQQAPAYTQQPVVYQAPQSHYQQQAYPSSQYVHVQYQYQPKPSTGMSITAMILGIASFIFWFTVLVPIAGLVLGIVGLKKEPAGRGMAIAGIVLSSIVLGIALILFMIYGGFILAMLGLSAAV